MDDGKKLAKNRNKFLAKLRGKNNSVVLSESKYGEPDHYISTGSYALNRIISGDIHKGIPSGRIIIWAGENSVGKSLAVTSTAGNALRENDYDMIFVFDSELGASKSFFESFGCDSKKVEQVLVTSVEDCQLKMVATLNDILEHQEEDPDFKAMFILDSIGGLVAEKVHRDASKGRVVSEMGARAKQINNMVKALTIPAAKTGVPINIINHVYADPTAMFPSKIKNQGGGEGLKYMASVSIQIAKKLEKNTGDAVENEFKGNHLIFFTVKNRLVKPFHRTELYIDFDTGIHKYNGLVDTAIKMGFIEAKGAWYKVPSYADKNVRMNDILYGDNADEIWGTFLDEFNTQSRKEIEYSSIAEKDKTNKTFDKIEEKLEKEPVVDDSVSVAKSIIDEAVEELEDASSEELVIE